MIFTNSRLFHITIAVLCFMLVSCDSDNTTAPSMLSPDGNTLVGRFVDSPVSGLLYNTSSGLSGMTNAAGEFQFLADDTVTFSLGAIVLGSTKGASRITPFDLAGFELPSVNLDFDDLTADIIQLNRGDVSPFSTGVNLLILLQSLDRNNNADDGIEIPTAVFQFFTLAVNTVLFNQNADDFLQSFLTFFLQLVTLGHLERDLTDEPVDKTDALRHFVDSNF